MGKSTNRSETIFTLNILTDVFTPNKPVLKKSSLIYTLAQSSTCSICHTSG